MDRTDIEVRNVLERDLDRILELERRVYGPLGTPLFGGGHFRAWMRVHPEGFFLAEREGRIVGYKYSQAVEFEFDLMYRFRTYDEATDSGYTVRTHDPGGNALKGVSLCSVFPGAGRALFERTFSFARETGRKYYFSFTRIAGFDKYMKCLENQPGSGIEGVPEEDVVLWYILGCAAAAGGKLWPTIKTDVRLPFPRPAYDPVLSKQLRLSGFGAAGAAMHCMKDPESRDHAAFMVYKNPHWIE